MKTYLLAAIIILLGLASCSVTQPNDREYYPQQRVYSSSPYQVDTYYNTYDSRYSTQRVYDYNTGRYYDVPVYYSPVYTSPGYSRRNYRRENEKREYYDRDERKDNNRNDEYSNRHQNNQQSGNEQPREKRFPDGTRISENGTITLPNGEVRHGK